MNKNIISKTIILMTISPALATWSQVLAWHHNSENDLAGYRVYFGHTTPGDYHFVVDNGKQTIFQLAMLTDYPQYNFAVTAYDNSGNESDYSENFVWDNPNYEPPTEPPPAVGDSIIWRDDMPIKIKLVYGDLSGIDTTGFWLRNKIVVNWKQRKGGIDKGWKSFVWCGNVDVPAYSIIGDSILSINAPCVKQYNSLPLGSSSYLYLWGFRIRIESKTDATKFSDWLYTEKTVQLVVAGSTPPPVSDSPIMPFIRLEIEGQ